MSQHLRRRAAAVLLTLAVACSPVHTAVAVETVSSFALTVLGEGGFLMRHGTEAFTDPARVTVHVSEDAARDQLSIEANAYTEPWARISVGAPTGRPRLEVGRYTSQGSVSVDDGLLDMSVSHRACGRPVGSFDVLGLSRGPDGRLTGLALDYAMTCDGDPAPVRGSLRWNSEIPYRHTAVASFRAPDTGAGATASGTVTLTNAGTLPQTYGRTTWQPEPTLGGERQATVTVTADGCVDVTLDPGRTCTVAVGIPSDGDWGVGGYLRTPDETSRGAAYSLVTMRAVPAPTAVTLAATPARGEVRLSTSEYNPAYHVLRTQAGGREVEVARNVTMPWSDPTATPGTSSTYRVVPVSGGVEGVISNAVTSGALPVPVGAEGTFVPIDPVRVFDTRDGTGGRRGALGPGATVRFDPARTGDIPSSGVAAVLLNLTGTQATAPTHVQAWPAGSPRPATSSLNLVPGRSRPNQVVVPLGADGQVELSNHAGWTHLVVDVQGFYSEVDGVAGGGYHPTMPARVFDTRADDWPLEPGEEVWLPVGDVGLSWSEVTAVDVNLTVTQPTSSGYITAWPGDVEAPVVSNANFVAGQTVANHAVVPVTFDERGEPGIAVRNSHGDTHLVVDVQGWYDDGTRDDGLRFATSPTSRVLDTRQAGGRVEPGGRATIPGAALPLGAAHVVNVTATGSLGAGYLTAWSGYGWPPPTSSLNFTRAEDAPNLATALAAPGGGFVVSVGTNAVHVVVDHLGFFY